MSVLISSDKKELITTCECGCNNGVHIIVDNIDSDSYAFMSYMNGNFYRDQDSKILRIIGKKLKKIWAIIRNKDFYYSEIVMSKNDFVEFKDYINQFCNDNKINEVASVLREELLKHGDLYEGFLSSIRSAIYDRGDISATDTIVLSEHILKRITGEE